LLLLVISESCGEILVGSEAILIDLAEIEIGIGVTRVLMEALDKQISSLSVIISRICLHSLLHVEVSETILGREVAFVRALIVKSECLLYVYIDALARLITDC
jgi:hypothetical protein